MSAFLVKWLGVFVLLGPGALAPADELVLERVAERRVEYGWGLAADLELDAYDALLGVEDCGLLGAEGALVVDGRLFSALVVDCQQEQHEPLGARGLVADVNRGDLGHEQGMVVLWPQR